MSQELKSGDELLRMERITKSFLGVVANNKIHLEVKAGEIHCLLGENGAGKTTLMNVLYGLYRPDEGDIYVYGRRVSLKSPRDAIDLGIGMVHQRFMLFPPLKVVHNIIIGLKSNSFFLDIDQANRTITELSNKYGLKVNSQAVVSQLSMGERQRVEIVKALYRNANLLILDEPTSVLTPQEVNELFSVVRSLTKQGKSVIFITHKLQVVMAISDTVTVMRRGKVVGSVPIKDTSRQAIADMMVGRPVLFRVQRTQADPGEVVLAVKNLNALDNKNLPALRGLSFTVREAEILGIAGVEGNGQSDQPSVSRFHRILPFLWSEVAFVGPPVASGYPASLGAEDPVSRIAKAGHDVAPIVQV